MKDRALTVDRIDLHVQVIRLARLPEGKKSLGYFTRQQLEFLIAYLERSNTQNAGRVS